MKKFRFLAIPYLVWMIILVIIPLLTMVVLSFTEIEGLDFSTMSFSTENIKKLFSYEYIDAFWYSIKISAISTIICVIIGYATAFIISMSKIKHKMALLLVIILPMWTNMLLRILAFEKLFAENGVFGSFGAFLKDLGPDFAVIFATVSIYLPFMILPIYTVLEKMNRSFLEASSDLGVKKVKTFKKIILPLSMKGVFSGIMMVFLPSALTFAIPERLNSTQNTIGKLIEQKFKQDFDYGMGSLLSVVVLVIILGSVLILNKIDSEGETLL